MGDKVYLWELDSVRNSPEECRIARDVLYNTLLVKGKTVVMTFNQLADGKWILPLLKDEDNYQYLLKLFQIEAIKLSRYGKIRTVSHYVQNSLEKALQKKNDFIFSGMDIEKEERYIVQEVLEAIRYSDPERLLEDVETLQMRYNGIESGHTMSMKQGRNGFARWKTSLKNKKEESAPFDVQVCRYYSSRGIMENTEKFKACLKYEIDRLQVIYRYVKVILLISEKKTLDNRAVKNPTQYATIMDYIIGGKIEKALKNQPQIWTKLFEDATREMKIISVKYNRRYALMRKERSINNRSLWHRLINHNREKDKEDLSALRDFQILLADVCYNFTLESSIDGIECSFDKKGDGNREEFIEDFIQRVDERYNVLFLKNCKVGKARSIDIEKEECLDWKQLVEIREDVYKRDYSKRQKPESWSRKVWITQVVLSLRTFAVAVCLFVLVNLGGNTAYEFIVEILTDAKKYFMGYMQGEQILLSNIPQNIGTVVTNLWYIRVRFWPDLINDIIDNIVMRLTDIQVMFTGNTDVPSILLSGAIVFLKEAIKVMVIAMIVSGVQRREKPLDILDIVTNWKNKLSNWKKFKRRKLEVEELEQKED